MDIAKVKGLCESYFTVEKPKTKSEGIALGMKIASYITIIIPLIAAISLGISTWYINKKITVINSKDNKSARSMENLAVNQAIITPPTTSKTHQDNIRLPKEDDGKEIITPPTTSKINQSNIRLLKEDGGKEIRVPVGKPFSIMLSYTPSTGHDSWRISDIPSFINQLDQNVNYINYSPDFSGGGNDYVFDFEPNGPGRGNIVMQKPCSFDASRTEEIMFTIIAE